MQSLPGSLFRTFVFLCLPAIAVAQSSQTITLEQAIQIGTDASKQLKVSQSKLDYAQAKHDETFDLQYPTLKLDLAYNRLSSVDPFVFYFPGDPTPHVLFPVYLNSYQNKFSVSDPIFEGFRVKDAKDAADQNLGAVHFDMEKDKDDVKMNIINVYYGLYKAEAALAIIEKNLTLISQRVKDIQNLEANGLATHNDVLRLQLQESNTQLSKLDAENFLRAVNYNFNLLLGMNGDVNIHLDTTSIFQIKNISAESDYLTSAAANRPELMSLSMKSKAAADNLSFAQKSWMPTVNAVGDFYYSKPNPRIIPPTNIFEPTWDIGVALKWNITDVFTNKHLIAESQALLNQTNALADQLADGIKSEVYQNYLSYNEAIEKLAVLEKAVAQAEENLNVTTSRYQNNVAIISDLTDAQTQQIQSEINLQIAKADAQIAYYKLMKSSGNF